jgi:hypothetical protein
MDGKLKESIEKKLKEGWIQTVMMIEVLASTEEAAKSSLEKHVASLEKEKKTLVGRKDFKGIRKIDNPLPNVEVGYSNIVELEVLAENLETLVYLAMNYAPSSIEILRPEKIELDMGEAQGILVSVADMLHKFARQGLGGVVIRS